MFSIRKFTTGVLLQARRQGLSTNTRCLTGHTTPSLHGNDSDNLEKEKQDALRKHEKDSKEEPRWREELASESEASVKAERDEIPPRPNELAKKQ